jgi:hypothetical protein
MKLNKSILSISVAAALTTAISSPAHADIIDINFTGLFTFLDSAGNSISNSSNPYYSDPTWAYGARTQISGTLQYDTNSNTGSAAVNSFEFLEGGPAVISNFEMKSTGNDGLLLANMNFNWNNSDVTNQLVLDGSGLFAGIDAGLATVGNTIDTASCASGGALHNGTNSLCSTPASNGAIMLAGNAYPIGPAPLVTTSFNTTGQHGRTTILDDLSLGTNDSIGGSQLDNGPFQGAYFNFDFTSLEVTSVSAVPVPAAAWLFGSGLVGLIGIVRRRKQR